MTQANKTAPLFERIDRVILPVTDIHKAAQWYADEFEFRIARRREQEIDLQVGVSETKLTLMEVQELTSFLPLPHLDPKGHVPCFNFYTHWEDLHQSWLIERGIPVTSPMNNEHMNICEMSDISGNIVGICHEKAPSIYYTPFSGPLPPMFHRVLAVFIPVIDLEKSIRWYSETLGFALHNHWGQGADLTLGSSEAIVTMIQMDAESHANAVKGLRKRAYYSLQTLHIYQAHEILEAQGVNMDQFKGDEGLRSFHISTPEGLKIRISEKELIPVG
ncbi:VOC family protein [Neobacillus mesonae]|nr:VOC family protein [Neobacillus mesonae]